MNTIVIVIVGFLAVAVIYETLRKNAQKSKEPQTAAGKPEQEQQLTADEALPTQTGRFRAKEALEKIEQHRAENPEDDAPQEASSEGPSPFEEDPDSPLPDPFSREDKQ